MRCGIVEFAEKSIGGVAQARQVELYRPPSHRIVDGRFSNDEPRHFKGASAASLVGPLAILVFGTVAIAFKAELVSGALEATSEQLHIFKLFLFKLFLGIIVLALVGTSADLFAAVVLG